MKTNAIETARLAELSQTLRKRREGRERRARLLKHVFLIVLSFIMLYPLIWLVMSSLKPEAEIFGDTSLIPSKLQFENYTEGWNALPVSFTVFYWNSIIVTVL